MIQDEERTKDLLEWAERFSRIKLDPQDVRFPIQAHVRKIDGLMRMRLDVSGASEHDLQAVKADAEEHVKQLDYLRIAAVALAASAKLEQVQAARSAGGKATTDARKRDAKTREARVSAEADRLRAAGTPEHKLAKEIENKTGYSRTTVSRYLQKK